MSHTIKDKAKLLHRVRRVRGQIEAVERALEDEKGCANVLHLVVAARGAMNSLMAEIIEGHIRTHVVDPNRERRSQPGPGRARADRRRAGLSEVDGGSKWKTKTRRANRPLSRRTSAPSFGWIEGARIVAVVALAAVAVRFHLWEPLPHVSVIGIAGLVIGGWPIFEEAFEHVAARRMTMELSMAIAIVAAAAISEYFTALIITLFVLIAEVLEGMTVSRGRRAIRDLLDFMPRTVTVRRGGGGREISADALKIGDSVLVNPGGAGAGGRRGDWRTFIRR